MYECQECGNISQMNYKCCELCGCDEWIKNENYQEKEPIRIEFRNGSAIKSIKSEDSVRGKRAKYFNKINEYIANLPDKEFDELLIECGIEKCPYENEY
ncbi:hypothetical protein ACR77J_07190 [Tissierella praeacuta]|uniref:hypothetical protein n=1 Tax=Tissierella praeacuta TaxID=43131 RepID=UPI003DA4BE60